MLHHVRKEVYFQRFPGIFTGFIEMYLNERISLDYFDFIPLFSSGVKIDPLLSSMAQNIMVTESYFPNFVIFFLILHYFTGLSPQDLVVLPLGVLFIPIAYYAMIKVYIPINNKSNLIFHFLLGSYVMLYLVTTKMYGSFYVATSAFLLLLIIFLCIKKFYEKGNRFYYLIICLTTISLAQYWHSALMIEIFFIISLWLFTSIFNLFTTENKFFKRSTSLLITPLIISLTFVHLWQSSYIGDFFRTVDLLDFISKTLTQLIGGNPFHVPYAFNYKSLLWGKVYFISTLLIYILSTLILIISLFPYIFPYKNIRKKSEVIFPLIFSLAIILAQIINNFVYYKAASINFFYVPLFFSIFGIHSFVMRSNQIKEKFRKVIVFSLILMCILSSLSILSFHLTDEVGATSFTKYKDTRNSFEWLYHKMNQGKTVFIDFNILGKYLQREAKMSKPSIEYQHLLPDTYGVLIGDNEISKELSNNYAVLDHATMSKGLPIQSHSTRFPLEQKWIQIDNCLNQFKIYEDNYVSIFIFK